MKARLATLSAVVVALAFAAPACESSDSERAFGAACEDSSQCADNNDCIEGKCQPAACAACLPNEVCTPDGDCVLGFGQCEPPCSSGEVCSQDDVCIPEGTCRTDVDCGGGLVCDQATETCIPGGDCGQQEILITALPPNVLITLDRTGSMDSDVPNSGMTRYEVATDAVATLLQLYDGTINFGLNMFSACTGNGCAPGTIVEPIGAASADINAAVAATMLCFSGDPETSVGVTLDALIGETSLQEPGRDNVILLITDGQDNCGGGGAMAAAGLLAQPVPVKVYVVGFSGDVNATELQAIADASGTGQYLQADNAMELNNALQGVASSVASCTYVLNDMPQGSIFVFFDNDPAGVPNSSGDGWTYDAGTNTVTFHGEACDRISDGTVDDIDIVFGCSAPTPD